MREPPTPEHPQVRVHKTAPGYEITTEVWADVPAKIKVPKINVAAGDD